jgi:hypothetical protein
MTTGTEIELRAQASLPAKVHYAKALADSGLLPSAYRKQPANVLYAIEYGDMLGLSPMAAITGVHIIEGKPTASAALISALVRRAGHKLRVRGDAQSAWCQIVRCDDPDFPFEVTFTIEDAKTAGLTGKKVWQQYGSSMLKSRAITQCARDACEEALFGLHYTPEELGAEVDEDGAVVGSTIVPDEPAQVVESDQGWLAASRRVIPDIGLEACRKLWQETVGKHRAGELTFADRDFVLAALTVRMEALKPAKQPEAAPQETAEPPRESEVVEAEVVIELDPEDPWALKLEEIVEGDLTAAGEALDEATGMLASGELDPDHYDRVKEAILTRWPDAARDAGVAA